MASVETATLSLRLFIFVSPFFKVHRSAPIATSAARALICDYKKHISIQKKSLARSTDFPNYIGEGYSIESILEAVLRFF